MLKGSEGDSSPKQRSIRMGQMVTAHLDNIRQTVKVEEIFVKSKRRNILFGGERGFVKFTFIKQPEFIHVNRY